MKFLIIDRLKDAFLMLPLEQQARIVDGTAAFIEKYKKAGICKEIYSIPSIHGNISIWDVDTAEKGALLFRENPVTPFENFEMYILSDYEVSMKAQKEIYQQLLAKK